MKHALRASYVANLIRMLRSDSRSTAACIVEGCDDSKVLRSMFDMGKCQIYVAHGWENVVDALQILEKSGVPGVIAVIDSDFGRVDGRAPESPNLMWTDFHDLEMDMFHSPALDKLVTEFCDDETKMRPAHEVRDLVMKAATPLGYLRLVSHRDKLCLKMRELTCSDFIDKDTLEVDEIKMIRCVKNKSQRHDLNEEDVRDRMREIQSDAYDLRQVCRGHDVTAVFALGIRKVLSNRNTPVVPAERIEENLRAAFHQTHFGSTKLYDLINDWEARNAPFVALAA